ncbi:MAG: DUF4349 domain-containing protein [Gemmatimonadota bacterium]|nr:DUF4349 domain-containing protein [Gemmatimonadota bacterium]
MRAVVIFAMTTLLAACGKEGQSGNDGSGNAITAVDRMSTSAAVGKFQGVGMQSGAAANGVAPAVEAQSQEEPNAAPPPPGTGGDLAIAGAAQIAPAMVIRNGQASVEVDKLDPAIVKLRQLAAQLGGYIANSSMSGGRDQIRAATLELKIPAQRFDQAINGLSTLGKVESVNATAEDVGEEYVDITARVNNAHRLEDRLIELLATRTGKLQDVLSVERELARVREEIERYEGRLRFLKTRVATSTLSVTIHEAMPILGQSPGQNPITEAIRRAWRNFVGFIASGIAALGVLIPLAALAFVGWLAYKRFRRRG